MSRFYKMQLKFCLALLFAINFYATGSQASYLGVMMGPKSETYTQENITERSRLNPASILIEYGSKIKDRWYLSGSVSGEFNISDRKTVGFSLHSFLKYYFIGYPDSINGTGLGANISFESPYTFFIGIGLFHKNIQFFDNDGLDVNEDIGGLGLSIGGSYDLSKTKFLMSNVQYLTSGTGSGKSYSSLELYLGVGVRF